ncbi:MAG TPA: 1,4-dihydroxy-2-naphthoate polyprenyltransferase [Acidimicrobiales bacterium]|jgi:1,4-dihydroxy-2-naphthoate octaprenyltransferase|nr:1,4-dihydroxy-2-naphthoate polyprenyltransferase [Acidimicrobiales bacterium]
MVQHWIAGARPRTLPAAVVPVLVGTGAAVHDTGEWNHGIILWRAIAALVVSLAIQVGTNYANDYSDGVKGTDSAGRVGPIRLVASGLAPAAAVKQAAFASFAVAGIAGLALAAVAGWWLLAVGAACFLAGWFYTGGPRPYGYAGLGELFVFVFFGLVATVGSTYVQREDITGLAVAVAVPVGLLATALLVVNNLRDIPSDTRTGKRTLAVRLGATRTRWLYLVLMTIPFVLLPFIAGLSRVGAALAFVALPFARRPVQTVLEGAAGPRLIPVLGSTGRVQLLFGVGLAVGLAISG